MRQITDPIVLSHAAFDETAWEGRRRGVVIFRRECSHCSGCGHGCPTCGGVGYLTRTKRVRGVAAGWPEDRE